MLVLSRKQSESIQINDNITVTVLKFNGKTVRLGIEAPRHIRVLRGELPRYAGGDEPVAVEQEYEVQEGAEVFAALAPMVRERLGTNRLDSTKKS